MSDDSGSASKLSIGFIIILLLAVGLLVANTVTSQGKITQLQKQLTETQKQINDAEAQVAQSKQAIADETKKQANEVADAVSGIESPIARFGLVKRYYNKIAAALQPDTKKQLDGVIIFVEKQPSALIDPTQLPASMSATLSKAKAELKTAKGAVAAQIASEANKTASPSAIVGKTFSLTGTLTFVEDDPVLGGSYFKLTGTNYGEPYILYLSPANAAQAKATMEGQVVTVQVKVTGQKDGYVTYDVVSGPTLQ